MDAPLPEGAWSAALASLPAMGPARLRALLTTWPPAAAWDAVCRGRVAGHPSVAPTLGRDPATLAGMWRRAASAIDVAEMWDDYVRARVGVATAGGMAFPAALATDVEPPAVLFSRGDPDVLAGPRVAIVGTRRCSRYGVDIAHELGHDLATAGVAVVSGLAAGIDGAAHAGALSTPAAPPIAVVGSGLDVVYPARNAGLWRRVEDAGVVLSEAPLGARPEAWRFPARNRIIAALADVVVVVESHEHGGSMHTVAEALRRDRPVLAVPGPVRSPSSAGTNRLLSEGMGPARDATDVLLALGLSPAVRRNASEQRATPSGDDATVLDAVGWQPASLEQLAGRTGLPLPALALATARLEGAGWVARRGPWYERIGRDAAS